ncbi:MAG: indolepyruvate ferredoxin oxidoreductase subunit alpha [Fibromonadaceae bacterium]|jgi:indolepyruvate ferredoxin oxidoreductase alpha subunit|nr:indolepyruvate ferredoxin oxidoreductase subunit alpha [Fibromonadaceae bacterium]
MKKLMLGDHAVAQGAYEAGVKVAAAYPGTPSTEITEFIANFEEVNAEWAVNEKTSMEVGIGSAMAGRRALVAMKHVGLNVAADPLFTFAYTGVNAGLVVAVADDPGMHSSQNEQDSRYYAQSAHVPMLEPADSQEAKDFTMLAYELSEKYDTPVFLRLTTRIAHGRSFVEVGERKEVEYEYKQNIPKYVMVPANARNRHPAVEERERRLLNDINDAAFGNGINKVEYSETGSNKIGVVCSGAVYQYVKEVLPDYAIFKLGMVYPIAVERIREFAKKCEKLIVIEELEPYIENTLKANGIECSGKNLTGLQGELSAQKIREVVLGQKALPQPAQNAPGRPPVMCAGCTHRGVFYIFNKLKLNVVGDIGCYSLGCSPPLNAMHSLICMGAAISNAHGMYMAKGKEFAKNNIAVIGDSTFIHSGITSLIDAVYNKSSITVVILDNRTTGMTGHQNHPGTGKTIKGEPTHALDLEAICRACGVENLSVIDPYNLSEVEGTIKKYLGTDGVSVIIAKRPCILLDKSLWSKSVTISDCKKCSMCLKIGCPALNKCKDNSVVVDSALCTGCMVCAQTCKTGSIKAG